MLPRPLTQLTRKNVPYQWTQSCQTAFEIIKQKLMSAPILAQFQESADVTLHCDASLLGIGCVLSQIQNGREVVIAFASRALTPTEYKWSIAERECLAVIFGLKRFHEYCYGRRITVLTDQHSLCSIIRTRNSKNLGIACWALEIQGADITVKYKKGTLHGNADCLSRLVPLSKPSKGCDSVFNVDTSPKNDSSDYRAKLKSELLDDKYFSDIIKLMKNPKTNVNSKINIKYTLIDELLYRICSRTGQKKLCIPTSMINDVLFAYHEHPLGGGHAGMTRMYNRI